MKLNPIYDRIVVKRIKPNDVTKGGILLPNPEKSEQAEVIAAGPGRLLENGSLARLCVDVGDRVLLGKYSGTIVTVDGDELLVLREDDVLAIIV